MLQPDTNRIFFTPTWLEAELCLAGVFNNRLILLLTAIDACGSINQAAKQVGLSYKGAWQILEKANNSAPQILVATTTGGNKGGGSRLTEAGQRLVALFSALKQQHQLFLEQLNDSLVNNPAMVLLLQRLVIKTSARNQLFGRVTALQAGAVNGEVVVELKGGESIVITMEMETLNQLGLKLGIEAVLLINSTDITVITDFDAMQFSARNRLYGKVIRVQQGAVSAEVLVLLPSGEIIAAMITEQSGQNLALAANTPVWMLFKSNTVILGSLSPR